MTQKTKLDMEYNSQMEELIMPEYGRNVQRLIFHAKTIENDEYRQRFVEQIIRLMFQMQPMNRTIDEIRDKLWKHLFRIANYDIKATPPNGVIPTPEAAMKRPDKVEIPQQELRFRHYGSGVQKLIRKALEMEPGPKREGLVAVIASYMKLAYRTWNKEHFVSDDVIKADLEIISAGRLVLSESIENLIAPQQGSQIRRKFKPSGGGSPSRQFNGPGNNKGSNKNRQMPPRNKRK
jgi:hypothetical protein